VTDEKQAIREQIREARREILPNDAAILSARASGRLLGMPEALGSQVVLGYHATTEEIDPAGALSTFRRLGATICLPRIVGKGALVLHQVDEIDGLEEGPHGIRQPSIDSPIVDPAIVDLAIVPGVAFDVDGARIGYGGGYYDRLLPNIPRATWVGFAYDEQLLADIPHEAHDTHVHVVVTPSRVIPIRGLHDTTG
jgi:5-formyltetrahydrofolate cyclo-ligase